MTEMQACAKVIEGALDKVSREVKRIKLELRETDDKSERVYLLGELMTERVKQFTLESLYDDFEFKASCIYHGIDPYSGRKNGEN